LNQTKVKDLHFLSRWLFLGLVLRRRV